MNPNDHEYREYWCAFIDVLGFRQLVNTKNAVASIKPYFEISETIRANWSELESKSEIGSLVFSDSIFLAVECDVAAADQKPLLRDFLIAIGQLQVTLALNNIWLRGAVTRGPLYFKSTRSIAFGPALVRAYDLEQRHAKYPRIILDVNTVDHFNRISNTELIAKVNTPPLQKKGTWTGPVLEEWGEGRYELGLFHRDVPFQIDFLGQFFRSTPDFGDPMTTLCENIARKAREGFEAYEKMKWVADYLTMRSLKEDKSLTKVQLALLSSI